MCPFWFFLSLNASIFLLSLYPPLRLLGVLSIYVLHPQTDVCPLRDSPQEDVICPTLKSDIMLTVHFVAQLTDNTLCPGSAEQLISCLTNTYPPYSLGTLNLCDASITCPIMDADMRRVPASINTPDACDCYDARALLLIRLICNILEIFCPYTSALPWRSTVLVTTIFLLSAKLAKAHMTHMDPVLHIIMVWHGYEWIEHSRVCRIHKSNRSS